MAVFQQQGHDGIRFVVRPNCALSWRMTKYLIWFFAAALAAVAAYFASLGAWLVLPFAGLELVVLIAGFYLSALAGHTREVIEIDGPVLRVLRGRSQLDEVAGFPANWTQVALRHDPKGWYPSRLLLQCHGKGLEVGAKLVESEREELAMCLRDILDFHLLRSDRVDHEPISARLRGSVPAGSGTRPALDEDVHVIKNSLAPKGARVAGCARGAFTKR